MNQQDESYEYGRLDIEILNRPMTQYVSNAHVLQRRSLCMKLQELF